MTRHQWQGHTYASYLLSNNKILDSLNSQNSLHYSIAFLLGFTPCKAEHPLQSTDYKKEKHKKIHA